MQAALTDTAVEAMECAVRCTQVRCCKIISGKMLWGALRQDKKFFWHWFWRCFVCFPNVDMFGCRPSLHLLQLDAACKSFLTTNHTCYLGKVSSLQNGFFWESYYTLLTINWTFKGRSCNGLFCGRCRTDCDLLSEGLSHYSSFKKQHFPK